MKVVAECDCGKLYRLPEKYSGKLIRCKACGDAFEVPELEDSLEESGMEEDFPDPESEVIHAPKKKSKKKSRESTRGESSSTRPKKDDSKSKKASTRASGVRKGRRGDESGDDKKRTRESSTKKRGPRDSGSRRGATDEKKSKGLKRDSKAMKSSRGRSGEREGKGRGRKGSGKSSRGDRGDREERGGRRGGRRGRDEPKNNNMMYAGIGGGVLVVALLLFVTLGKTPPPDPAVAADYKAVEKLLDKGLKAYKKANMTQSLEFIDTVKKEWDKKDATKYPVDNEAFENFGPKYKEAMALLPKLLKYDSLLVQLKEGKGIADTVKFTKESDPLLRLASVTLIEQKLKDNKDLQGALAKLAGDSDAKVKEKALDLICKLKEPVALPFLIDRIKSNHKESKTYILLISKMVDKAALKAYYVCLTKLDPSKDKDQLSDVSNIIKNINKVGDEDSYKVLLDYRDKWPKDLQTMIDKIGTKYKKKEE
ncbi:MAG: HEAT repeat domain-containing protein [Planctomycetota bacterium]|nr:HEAT repeat domain-containing protein [Planctomycetota bacterium]